MVLTGLCEQRKKSVSFIHGLFALFKLYYKI